MKKLLYIILVLTIIGCISGGILAFAYQQMSPLIIKNQQSAAEEAVFKVISEAKSIKKYKSADGTYYDAYDKNGQLVGYAVICEGNGYQGKIKIIVGVSPDLSKYTGIDILEQVETPGLGAKIANPSFMDQFSGLLAKAPIELVKNQVPATEDNEIQAITGATISSKAVVNIINKGITEWLKDR